MDLLGTSEDSLKLSRDQPVPIKTGSRAVRRDRTRESVNLDLERQILRFLDDAVVVVVVVDFRVDTRRANGAIAVLQYGEVELSRP